MNIVGVESINTRAIIANKKYHRHDPPPPPVATPLGMITHIIPHLKLWDLRPCYLWSMQNNKRLEPYVTKFIYSYLSFKTLVDENIVETRWENNCITNYSVSQRNIYFFILFSILLPPVGRQGFVLILFVLSFLLCSFKYYFWICIFIWNSNAILAMCCLLF